jgi:membrane-bound lytic murein transglycosylase F
MSILRRGVCLALTVILTACGWDPLADDELVVVTRNAATTWYEDRDGVPAGPEHDLVMAFAAWAGVEVRWEVRDSVAEVLEALKDRDSAIAAAGLSVTEARRRIYSFGPVYGETEPTVVCRRGGRRPTSIADLEGLSLALTSASAHVEILARRAPDLAYEVVPEATELLLQKVVEREIDCTVADSQLLALHRRYLPDLEPAFALESPQPIAWVLDPRAVRLQRQLRRFFESETAAEALANIEYRYYAFINEFDYVDSRALVRRILTHYPRYAPHFRDAAEVHGLDPLLLAALAYQESRWDPAAVSPTGVRGLMQLTQRTANSLGVNRLDPVQSIHGAARYLAQLRDRLPESTPEPDRTWQALAAYNIGMGHVQDARELAARLGRNPDHWPDLAETLPLLADRQYRSELRHGYARGMVPVLYVDRVRDIHDILLRQAP